MLSVTLHYRPSTRSVDHPGVLFIRLIRHRKVKTLTLPDARIRRQEWDSNSGKVMLPPKDEVRAEYLRQLQKSAEWEIQRLTELDCRLSQHGECPLDKLLEAYRLESGKMTLANFTKLLSDELEHEGRYRTARAYRTVCYALLSFSGNDKLLLNNIDACLVNAFERHLNMRSAKPNTISYYMRNLRAIYNKAVNRYIILRATVNPFAKVYTGIARTKKRSLGAHEMARIISLNVNEQIKQSSSEGALLLRAQHYFAFSFYAQGMCFVDLAYLKKSDIQGDVLRYKRRKTGHALEVTLTKEMRAIIAHYSKATSESLYVFPIIRGEGKSARLSYENALILQNRYLKRLAAKAGVAKPVSTHWARHSWATIGKRSSIPIAVLSECLGHSSEKVTRIYLDSLDAEALDKANRQVISDVQQHMFCMT